MQPISFDVQAPAIVAPGEWSEVLFAGVERGHAWDLNRANLILRDAMLHLRSYRRIFSLPISAENQQALLNGALTAQGRDCKNMPPVDPNIPILLVQLGGRHYVIDGLSRARHAIFLGWDAIPAYLMTRYEEYSCRICPCCRPENRLAKAVREAREGRAMQAC